MAVNLGNDLLDLFKRSTRGLGNDVVYESDRKETAKCVNLTLSTDPRIATHESDHRAKTCSIIRLEEIRQGESNSPCGHPEQGGTDGEVLLTIPSGRHLGGSEWSVSSPRMLKSLTLPRQSVPKRG